MPSFVLRRTASVGCCFFYISIVVLSISNSQVIELQRGRTYCYQFRGTSSGKHVGRIFCNGFQGSTLHRSRVRMLPLLSRGSPLNSLRIQVKHRPNGSKGGSVPAGSHGFTVLIHFPAPNYQCCPLPGCASVFQNS